MNARAHVMLMVALIVGLAGVADAGKEHCRIVTFKGTAGFTSNDVVQIRILGDDGTLLAESCPYVVANNEAAEDFSARFPAEFGDGRGTLVSSAENCDLIPAYDPLKPPKKGCGETGIEYSPGLSTSCRLKYKFKVKKSTGEVKKGPQIEFCCYEKARCKRKLGKDLTGKTPIQIQAKVNAGAYTDLSLSSFDVVIDPIGSLQLPDPAEASCRKDLSQAAKQLAGAISNTLLDCRTDSLAGLVDPNTCPNIDPKGVIGTAQIKLDQAVAECAGDGSPSSAGFATCAAPCSQIQIGTCTAGTIGGACEDDSDCDTSPGAGDGACTGDWDEVSACIRCQTETAINTAYDDVHPPTVPLPPSPEAEDCLNQIGKALDVLLSKHVKEITKCQKGLDAARVSLATADDDFCKTADLKGIRQKSDDSMASFISKKCSEPLPAGVETCAGTLSELAPCVIRDARVAAEALADALYPETEGFSGSACSSDEQCAADEQCVDDDCTPEPCAEDSDCQNFFEPGGGSGGEEGNGVGCNEDLGVCCRVGVDPEPECDIDPTAALCALSLGSLAVLNTASATLSLALSGDLEIQCGQVDGSGKAICSCNQVQLDPVSIPGIGTVCASPAPGCPPGELNCNSGGLLDVNIGTNHNIGSCVSPVDCASQCQSHCGSLGEQALSSACEGFCQGGPADGNTCISDLDCPGGVCVGNPAHEAVCQCQCHSVGGAPGRPGALFCNLGQDFVVESNPPCDGSDILYSLGPHCIPLTTEVARNRILNLNNTSASLDPNDVIGSTLDCVDLTDTSGMSLVGSANWLDSALGDAAISFRYTCE